MMILIRDQDSKYAYQIKHVYILKEPIKLHELKEKYDFLRAKLCI